MENNKNNAPYQEALKENNTDIVPDMGAVVKQNADIDGFISKRQEFIRKVAAICVEGKDFHVIQNKKSLAKGGAEKIASIFQWNATFEKDDAAIQMLGAIPGLVAFKCTIRRGTKFVGEGRGAAVLSKNAGDPNKTLKMAQKSGFIDAVLRASGLSDFFTQDLEDMPVDQQPRVQTQPRPVTNATPPPYEFKKPTDAQVLTINNLIKQKGYNRSEIIEALHIDEGEAFDRFMASKVIDWLVKMPTKVVEATNVQ